MITEFSWLTAIMIGLAGSVHCAGMCGGIVTSMTFMLPKAANRWPYMLAYNFGRISSYAVAGGLAGYVGQSISSSRYLSPQLLPLLSGLLMLLMGLYIGKWLNLLAYLERTGALLWRKISPLSKAFIPFKHPVYAIPYGLIWGWLPCGLVYSTLAWSAASGSAINGALSMFAFGLGTLPIMLAMGASASRIRQWLGQPMVRRVIALSLIIFGLILSARAIHNW